MLLKALLNNPVIRHFSSIALAFRKAQIVPRVITKSPLFPLHVEYSHPVRVGKKVALKEVLRPPLTVKWKQAKEDGLYTLCMVDPDYPSRGSFNQKEYLHWLVVNIQSDNISGGDEIAKYIGPKPRLNTGWHRYVFLLFAQGDNIDTSFKNQSFSISEEKRKRFSIRRFQHSNNLTNPIAGNFFLSQQSRVRAAMRPRRSDRVQIARSTVQMI